MKATQFDMTFTEPFTVQVFLEGGNGKADFDSDDVFCLSRDDDLFIVQGEGSYMKYTYYFPISKVMEVRAFTLSDD